MKIKILNKNLVTSSYTSAKTYEIDEAPIFIETYNETLDSGTVIISNQSEKIIIEPYDIVAIYYDDNTFWKYMCVDTYTEQMTCVNPKIYRYEISLFSETKQLEGIILPNLKISEVWGITRSIEHYILQYMEEYSPYIRIDDGLNSYSYQPKWTYKRFVEGVGEQLIEKLHNKFGEVNCPEMQWNTPTLREVLNDLMMVADCIPILKNGVLDFLDLTEVKENMSEDKHINYVTRSKSSEDYVSELQVKLENVTNKTEGVNNIVTKTQYVTFNISDAAATMTTDNILIKTQYPIYNLKKFILMIPAYADYKNSSNEHINVKKWMLYDIMNIEENGETFPLIYEYQNWITKDIAYNTGAPSTFKKFTKYQNWTLYYVRGNNLIEGFNGTNKYLWMTINVFNSIIARLYKKYGEQYSGYDYFSDDSEIPDYPTIGIKIEYETLEGCLFRASKGDKPDNDRVVIDNQTNSFVDSYSQGFLEYQKANRLGNEQLQINARYNTNETTIEIGDTFDDCVIYQVQKQIFKDHIEVNAIATKNYILREYFTGVKSKIRSWKIANGSETLTRHDLEKYYCEFSYQKHIETQGVGELSKNNISLYLTTSFKNYTASPLKSACVRTIDYEIEPHPEDYPFDDDDMKTYFAVDLMTRVIGNSLVLTFGFSDNYWAGQSVHTENDYNGNPPTRGTGSDQEMYVKRSDIDTRDSPTTVYPIVIDNNAKIGGGIPMYQHRYTDDNGELEQLQVIFVDNLKVTPTFNVDDGEGGYVEIYWDDVEPETIWWDTYDNIQDQSQYFIYYFMQRPRIYESNIKWNGTHTYNNEKISIVSNHYKDSQEITNLSTQFEFSTETTNICFSKEWLKRQQAVAVSDNTLSLKAYIYPQDAYDFRRPDILPSVLRYDATWNVNPVDLSIYLSNDDGSNLNEKIDLAFEVPNSPMDVNTAFNISKEIRDNCCVYIVDTSSGENKVIMAINKIPLGTLNHGTYKVGADYYPRITLFMNILRTRNKNIYNSTNHYLIERKL